MGYHKMFHLRGINYECKLSPGIKRQEVINYINEKKDTFRLQEYTYKKKPALMVVCNRNDLDIGVVPAEDVEKILPHMDKPHEVIIVDRYYFEDNDTVGYKMQFRNIDEQKEPKELVTVKPTIPTPKTGQPNYDPITRFFYKLIGKI